MATITFDGPSRVITVGYDGPVTEVAAADLYSRWKDWVKAGNAQYEPAFGESVGGNELGGGVSLSGYYFIRNDLGWTLEHSSYDYQILVSGDLYPQNPAIPFLELDPDVYTVTWIFQRSAASYIRDSAGTDPATIAAAVWDETLADHLSTGTTGKRLSDVKPTLWGV